MKPPLSTRKSFLHREPSCSALWTDLMGHYSSASRKGYIMLHHTGSPNSHLDETTTYCQHYDFQVKRSGAIVVCDRWDAASGAHAAGCNCKAIGIMMMGCFGGCSSGNVEGPSGDQKCSVAYLIAHLGTPDEATRIRPHRRCASWNPCNDPNPTNTVCCGTEFTTGTTTSKWNTKGDNLVDDLRTKRRRWDAYNCCSCEPS
jgi:hypothetical protein